VAPEVSESISSRLEPVTGELSRDAYEAVLTGVSLAYGGNAQSGRLDGGLRGPAGDLEEIHQLLQDFAEELRKLDEALETLAAYTVRMRSQAITRERTLH